MKIAFLSSFAHLALDEREERVSGGAELQVALLAQELAKRGVEVCILAGNTGQPDIAEKHGVRVRNAGNFHTGRLLPMLLSAPRIFQLLRQERPEWVCVLGWTAWLFYLWLLRRFLQFRLVFICGLDTEVNGQYRRENPVRGFFFEFAMRHADKRYAMTELQRTLFAQGGMSCGFYRNLILPRRKPLILDKKVDFLWVARCRAIKNPHLFLKLAEALPDARFWMICPPEDSQLFSKIQEHANRLPNVKLWPGIAYHQIQDYYDAARVFVNTSEWEGWPNSFIQAGLGQSAILSWKIRPDRLFEDYRLGFCADANWELFVQYSQKLFQNRQQAEECGREASRFVRELHDNYKETENFLSYLKT